MFTKKEAPTEGQELITALKHKDTTITVNGPAGGRWTFCNDTAALCKLNIKGIVVTETADKKNILVDFWIRSTNGRLG